MAKILSVVDTAYRGTLEEQDDTSLWLTAACKNAGADMTVLLTGNAVNYAVKTQEASGLTFGRAKISHPANATDDLSRMIGKGVNVFLLREDAQERGIDPSSFVAGIEPMSRAGLAKFVSQFDLIWHW